MVSHDDTVELAKVLCLNRIATALQDIAAGFLDDEQCSGCES